MKRRDTILTGLALGAAGLPLAAPAQQGGKVWRVGIVAAGSHETTKTYHEAFLAAMKDRGYEAGRNLAVDFRYAEGQLARLPALVDEVMALKPDLLVAANTLVTAAMKSKTAAIPIVMATSGDPVGDGLVQSLPRPGGNVTGNSLQVAELGASHIELMADLLPRLRQAALLLDPSSVQRLQETYQRLARAAAGAKGIALEVHRADSLEAIRQALALMERQHVQGVCIYLSPRLNAWRREIASALAQARLPSIAFIEEYAQDGGLMSYGPSWVEAYRRLAYFVDRIFKGAKPADLPVEQPTRFSLVVNAKTARALGIQIPGVIRLRAERVIERAPVAAGGAPSIRFSDLEALIKALGGTVVEREGSRVRIELSGEQWRCPRPHPGKEAKRYQVEEARELFERAGVEP